MTKLQLELKKSPVIATMASGNFVTTVSAKRIGKAFITDWWTSRVLESGELEVFASMQIPIDARSLNEARKAVERLEIAFLRLLQTQASVSHSNAYSFPEKGARSHIARAHLVQHLNQPSIHHSISLNLQTMFQSELCKAFGVSSPAILLADLEGSNPKAINQRIFEARKSINHKKSNSVERTN